MSSAPVRTRRLALAAPALALGAVLLTGACGTAPASGPAAGAAATARPVAVSAGPATTVGASALGARVRAALAGVESGTATVTLTGERSGPSSASFAVDRATGSARVTARSGADSTEIRVVGGTVYADGPAVALLAGGRSWVGVPLSQLSALSGRREGAPAGRPSAMPDPAAVVGLVDRVVTVRDLGPTGAGAHAYRLALPVAALSAVAGDRAVPLPAPVTARVRQGVAQLSAAGVTTLSADLTLDAANRPVSVRTTTPAVDGAPATVVTVTFAGWGKPIRVTAPPAAQVTTLDPAQLAALSGRSGRPTV